MEIGRVFRVLVGGPDRHGLAGYRGTIAAFVSVLALFMYSAQFAAPFAVPKLALLSLGAAVLAVAPRERGLTAGMWLFLGAMVVSAFLADDRYLAVIGRHNSYSMGLLGALLASIYFMCAREGKGIVAAGAAILGLHAFAQWAGVIDGINLYGNRPISMIGSPVDLGMILAMCLPVAMSESKTMALPVGLGLFATGSRGSWLAAVAGVLAWRLR